MRMNNKITLVLSKIIRPVSNIIDIYVLWQFFLLKYNISRYP